MIRMRVSMLQIVTYLHHNPQRAEVERYWPLSREVSDLLDVEVAILPASPAVDPQKG